MRCITGLHIGLRLSYLIEGDSRQGVLDGTGSGKLRVSMAQVGMVSDFPMA